MTTGEFKNVNVHIPMTSESINAHTGNCTGQSWILMIPNTNIVTAQIKKGQTSRLGQLPCQTLSNYVDPLTENTRIPPFGYLPVHRHQPCVNIRLFMHRTPRLDPDLFTEVEEGMCESRGDRSERKTVGNGERGPVYT